MEHETSRSQPLLECANAPAVALTCQAEVCSPAGPAGPAGLASAAGALDRPGSDGGFLASRRSVSPARTGQGALQRGKIVRLLQHLETAAHRVLAARTIAR